MKYYKRLLPLLIASTLGADQFSFQIYNDFFAGTDKHFTNGMAFSWLDDTYEHKKNDSVNAYSNFMIDSFELISPNGLDKSQNYSAGMNISQMIITPIDTTISTPQYDDIPYAGYLALGFYIFEWDEKSFNEYRLDFGVVGPNSGAKQMQNTFHSLIGNKYAKGWDTQIGTEYTVNALYRYGETSWKSNKLGKLSMDWFNHFGFSLGTFEIDTFAGTMFRIGDNYVQNFNVHYPYLKEEAGLLEVDKACHGFGWSLSTGINGSVLAYSYIIDQAQKDGYDISRRSLNASLYLGAELYYNVHKLSYFYQSQSPYTNEQDTTDTYGSLMYSYQF
ncbi:MAG: lipid A deacylase LpxR family protein [Sulfurimonas sp.]|jgi:lipid A 3-O-deacylase|nr:lipid A deacylase LpxR family protein [Sulfurimonas sp.]